MRIAFHPRARVLATVAAVAAALAVAVPLASAAAASAGSAKSAASSADHIPHYNHIFVVTWTDHGFAQIKGNPFAPELNKLGREYGLANHYYGTSDPDIADNMAILAGNSYGVSDASPFWDQLVNKPSLLSQLVAAHQTWKAYTQDIPYPGYLGECYPTVCIEWDTLYNQYKFDPVPNLTFVSQNPAEARNIVPYAELATDSRTGHLPNFGYIQGNECTDMHGGPPWCIDSPNFLRTTNDNLLVKDGDNFFKQIVSEITSGPQWKHGNNAIVLVGSEGPGAGGCCDASSGFGHLYAVVVTNHKKHIVDRTPFNHYSLLATMEHAFGLGCLQYACDTKNVIPMGKLFGAKADGSYSFPAKGSDPVSKSSSAGISHPAKTATKTAASSATSPWTVVTSPDPSPNNDNDLWAISGRSPNDIWAVGSLLPNANATRVETLAVHYNGKSWTHVTTPDVKPEANWFFGVATLPDGTAWATGTYTPKSGYDGKALTEHWNGHKWTIVPAANPGSAENMLYSATGVSDKDVWAVGTDGDSQGFFHPLIEHWDGTAWRAVPIFGLPRDANGILTEVTSSRSQGVWAVGQLSDFGHDSQVLLHLDGQHWEVVRNRTAESGSESEANAYPQGISLSAAGVWTDGRNRIDGHGYTTYVDAPTGRGFREISTPNPTTEDNYLWGIAAVNGGANAWAVGTSIPPSTGNAQSLIEYGSATGGWTIVPSPDPSSGNNILDGVLAFSSKNVWAVGEEDHHGMHTFIVHYTGGSI